MRRLVAALMLVAGMALTVVGIGSATWWKESPIVEASTAATSESGIIATDPGVLELVDDTVRVTARAPGTEVEMAVASSDIAAIWLGPEPHVRVTGLTDWETLATEEPAEDVAPEGELTLQGSDLFHPENLIAATDSAEFYFDVPPGDWTLIAIGQDGTTPQLTMTWEREVSTPWAIPLIILGVVTLAAGSALYIFDSQQRGAAERRVASSERTARRRSADSTETSVLPAVGGFRRDRAASSADEVRADVRDETGGSYGAGILPVRKPAAGEDEDVSLDETIAEGEERTHGVDRSGAAPAVPGDDPAAVEADPDTHTEPGSTTEHPATTGASPEAAASKVRLAEDSLKENEAAGESAEGTVGESSVTGPEDSADADKRASSAAWRSLWGFGPKE